VRPFAASGCLERLATARLVFTSPACRHRLVAAVRAGRPVGTRRIRRATGIASSRRQWMAWGIAFRIVGLVAWPILDEDYYRFIWDGRMFALTGNPHATTPDAHFADAALPAAFGAILDHYLHGAPKRRP